ncbi:hypothetical protein BC832DRAFT_569523 [Gaertneriomyces semiglobifer]|nr:hypothetical protein BC832DRAFT_569523 [Gaertneriomyces semiglobifer]
MSGFKSLMVPWSNILTVVLIVIRLFTHFGLMLCVIPENDGRGWTMRLCSFYAFFCRAKE